MQPLADICQSHVPADQVFGGGADGIYRCVCVYRPDVAFDRKYRYQRDDAVRRAVQPERAVQYKLSGADGRVASGNAADGGAVSGIPEAVY